jgi:hypothetical protein
MCLTPPKSHWQVGWLPLDDEGHPVTELGYVRPDEIAELDALRRAGGAGADDPDSEGHAGEGEGAGLGDETGENGEDNPGDPLSTPGDKSALASTSETSGLSDALLTDLRAARTVGLRLELAEGSNFGADSQQFNGRGGMSSPRRAHSRLSETDALTLNAAYTIVPVRIVQ